MPARRRAIPTAAACEDPCEDVAVTARASVLSTIAVSMLIAGCGSGQAEQSRSSPAPSSTTSARARPGAGTSAGGLQLVKVADFEQPIYLTAAPGEPSRVFVVQRTGQIALLLNGRKQSRPYLDIHRLVNANGGEQGLLGLAFPADYAHTGLFYVDYTTANNDVRVAQY